MLRAAVSYALMPCPATRPGQVSVLKANRLTLLPFRTARRDLILNSEIGIPPLSSGNVLAVA